MAHVQKRTYTSRRTGKKTVAWQARYTAPDGAERTKRFDRKVDAERWLDTNGADMVRGSWIDPAAGQMTLRRYASEWLEGRMLRPTTRSKYDYLLDRHIFPTLGDAPLASVTPTSIRTWHSHLNRSHAATAAGAYRLLAAIFRSAVEDEKIGRSPCKVKNGARENAVERPVATVAELGVAVAAVPARYRLAPLLAAWCQLRRGEILGLQRQDIDLLHGTIKIERTWVLQSDGKHIEGPPKTDAGRRSITVPSNVLPVLKDHLIRFAGPSWLFPGDGDEPVSPRTIDRVWHKGRIAAHRADLRFHDLRHSGLTWAAATGASTAELMRRAGHRSATAALRYQHATEDRDRVLAEALGKLAAQGKVVPLRRTDAGRSLKSEATETAN
jgi:integrase